VEIGVVDTFYMTRRRLDFSDVEGEDRATKTLGTSEYKFDTFRHD